ncbi:hypothetical protein LZ30DRAFT_189453 [Colletotrichum cereale]|nr:hypothetical protein LZ30DRAFT_189453 [Colletotrichum cereale]
MPYGRPSGRRDHRHTRPLGAIDSEITATFRYASMLSSLINTVERFGPAPGCKANPRDDWVQCVKSGRVEIVCLWTPWERTGTRPFELDSSHPPNDSVDTLISPWKPRAARSRQKSNTAATHPPDGYHAGRAQHRGADDRESCAGQRGYVEGFEGAGSWFGSAGPGCLLFPSSSCGRTGAKPS